MKEIRATIRLKATEEYGKTRSIGNGGDYSCPVFFLDVPELSGHGYDCRLLLGPDGWTIAAGETAQNVPLAFLSPHEVIAHVTIGTRFTLWEAGTIGEGEITALKD
jgi:hypothetical protein